MKGKALSFWLGSNLLGIDTTLVKEINRNIEYTPIPGAAPEIIGLLNLRGQIVTLFNLAKLLSYEQGEQGKSFYCIILKNGVNDGNYIGFLVDRLGDVLDIKFEMCEAPPANAGGVSGEFLQDVVKLEKELLLLIDPDKIFERSH